MQRWCGDLSEALARGAYEITHTHQCNNATNSLHSPSPLGIYLEVVVLQYFITRDRRHHVTIPVQSEPGEFTHVCAVIAFFPSRSSSTTKQHESKGDNTFRNALLPQKAGRKEMNGQRTQSLHPALCCAIHHFSPPSETSDHARGQCERADHLKRNQPPSSLTLNLRSTGNRDNSVVSLPQNASPCGSTPDDRPFACPM